ncbi:MAG: hypothetical protein WCA78_16175 [Rhizomicrobium sp.]
MNVFRQVATGILCLIPAIALGAFAVPHLLDGFAVDAAIPVPVYMIAQVPMPKAAYEDAVVALGRADPRDGDAAIARAEASLRSGAQPLSQVPTLTQGLTQVPASARGWTLLSEAWLATDKRNAARALGQALLLAPHEYWLVGPRALDAAMLWPYLDADAQAQALEQTRMLWEEPLLRGQIRPLLFSSEGVSLVTRAFASQQDELRDMNRWLSLQRRQLPLSP